MRAAVLPAIGEKVEFYEDIDVVGPGAGEVRIRVHASGVCHSDLSGQNGTLPIPLPAVLGHEGAGEIIAVGDGVTALAPGDHVIVAWVPPCGICTTCINGQPQLCMDEFIPNAVSQRFSRGGEKLFGFAGAGTFAGGYDVTRRGGMTVVVGAGAMDAMVQFSAYELFFMEKTIQGSYYGSADVRVDFERLLRLWRQGRLDLEGMITSRIDVSEVNEAFEQMKRGEGIRS